jgi:hypothetical protein
LNKSGNKRINNNLNSSLPHLPLEYGIQGVEYNGQHEDQRAEDELGGTGEGEKGLDVPVRGLYGTPHLVVQVQHLPLR